VAEPSDARIDEAEGLASFGPTGIAATGVQPQGPFSTPKKHFPKQ